MSDTIFDANELAADAVQSDEANTATETQAEERLRDEQGRFAPKGDDVAPADDTATSEHDGKPRQVPQGALHAERERRKASETRAHSMETELRAAREQLDAIAALKAKIAAPQVPVESPSADDPSELAYLRSRLAEVEGVQQQFVQRDQMASVEQHEANQLQAVMAQSEARYMEQNPEYQGAIDHLVNARARELALYGLSPAQIQQAITEESREIVRTAIQQGKDPAEVGWELAQLRGYRPGAQPAAPPAVNSAAATVAAVGRAQATSRSLGGASGSSAATELNAQSIAAMTTTEFEALYSTPEGRKLIDAL